MSTELETESAFTTGAPELTALGKRLEILRIERGVSKQRLARHAGTSRQQLWRVMTGKSELTSSLRERLASALAVEPGALFSAATAHRASGDGTTSTYSLAATAASTLSVGEYLADPAYLVGTLRTLPNGDGGRRLKRALLNAVEDLAVESGTALSLEYSEIRRRVLAEEM